MLRRGNLLLAAAALVASTGTAFAQNQPTLEQDAVAFGTRETTTNMDLSPDGKLAVFIGAGPGRTTIVYVADISAGTTKRILYSKGEPDSIRWCDFASNTRIACQFTAIVKSDGGYVSVGTLMPASRMISLRTDGSDIKELGQHASDADLGVRQTDGDIIDWRPGGDNEVLMTRLFLPEGSRGIPTNVQRTKSGIGVVRLNVETLATKIVEPPRDGESTWMSDGQGNVRLHGIAELSGGEYTTGRTKYLYRPQGSRDWKPLTDYVDDGTFQPLAIDAKINSLYALRKRDGRLVLTKTALEDSPIETIVADNPRVDIDDVVRSGDGERVIGYTYVDDVRHTVYFDPEYKALSAALTNALPNHPAVYFRNASQDGTKVLLFAGTDRDPGRYYLFDKTKKSLGEIMGVRPNLAGRSLSEVKSIKYAAADGTLIPAYLTLPNGKEAKNLPAIVLPHGGPSSRDEWGFDWLAQFLVARGTQSFSRNTAVRAGSGMPGWHRTASRVGEPRSAISLPPPGI